MHDVVRQPKTEQRDAHTYGVEQEEKNVFALERGFLAMAKSPMTISEISESGGYARADDFCSQWLIE